MTKSHFKYIGIDPGKSGGITVIEGEDIKAYKCPQRTEDMSTLFSLLVSGTSSYDIKLLMERVWARPNNAVRSAFSYGVNYGQWMGIVACHEIPLQTCLPNEWIKYSVSVILLIYNFIYLYRKLIKFNKQLSQNAYSYDVAN